jgi:uncharacterized protein (TIGR03084 family)
MTPICDDLTDEHAALDALVATLPEPDFDLATPAAGWTIRDQLSHLWFFDQRALLALTDPDAFLADAVVMTNAGGVDASVLPGRACTATELLEQWRSARAELLAAARRHDPSSRVIWYGPPMAARSFITARLMETWAHGQDIADTLGVEREATDRLRHVAHIGVRARPFSYSLHHRDLPPGDVRVELTGPGGEVWQWGESSTDVVTGSALDFCLVVTQRRHATQTALTIVGDEAQAWIAIAQAFAGGIGRSRIADTPTS